VREGISIFWKQRAIIAIVSQAILPSNQASFRICVGGANRQSLISVGRVGA
jgi:4-oxalocrotonate tautomerase